MSASQLNTLTTLEASNAPIGLYVAAVIIAVLGLIALGWLLVVTVRR